MLRRFFAAAILFVAAAGARALPISHSLTDLWWDPNESGWGLNVIHQGDTLFATLFVYGPDGQPTWYSASLVTPGEPPAQDRPVIFSGPLVESTGPSFGSTFDPSRVTRRVVGSMAFEMPTGLLTYSVDGTAVTKHVQRFSFRGMDLSGDYVGYQSQATTSTGTALTDEMTIHVGQSGRNVTMTTQGSISGACTWTGTVTPAGQLASVQGSYACGDGRTGTFFMYDADVTDAGFTARFTGNRITSAVSGMMAGARTGGFVRGDGWRTDMWWVPTESGWGINLIEQGDILFATIFTYDAQGRAKWYSASSLAFTGRGPAVDSTGVYSGSVEESTGPYFGTSFNPASVTRRTVGSMSFDVYGNRTGLVDLSIGSATLARKVVDRYTFRTIDPSGTYAGNVQALLNSRNVPTGPTTFNIVANGGSVTITTQAAGGTCTYIATNAAVMQYGQQMLPAGSFSCSNGTSGQFFWPDMAVTYAGFTAHYNIDGYVVGNIGAVRTGPFASL